MHTQAPVTEYDSLQNVRHLELSHHLVLPCHLVLSGPGMRRYLSLMSHRAGDPGDSDMNPVIAVTFSCAAFHFLAVYNLQHHQRPVPLMLCDMVWKDKDPLSQ